MRARYVVKADGSRARPISRSLPSTSATKTQRERARRVARVLGEPRT